MNSQLEALAEGNITLDDCTISVLQFGRKLVKNFLKVNPSHGYLKDDLISAASLSMVIACQHIQQKGDIELANTNYLSTCVWNGLLGAVRMEQAIKPPRSFKAVLMDASDMPKRVPFVDIPVNEWSDAQEVKMMVGDLDLTEIERKVLDHRMLGCKYIEIARALGIKVYQLKKHVKSLQRKWESHE